MQRTVEKSVQCFITHVQNYCSTFWWRFRFWEACRRLVWRVYLQSPSATLNLLRSTKVPAKTVFCRSVNFLLHLSDKVTEMKEFLASFFILFNGALTAPSRIRFHWKQEQQWRRLITVSPPDMFNIIAELLWELQINQEGNQASINSGCILKYKTIIRVLNTH